MTIGVDAAAKQIWDDMELTEGAMVGADVRLLRPLDAGGMGSVWVGRHLSNNLEVAVKVIHKQLAIEDPSTLDRFEREASVLRRIRSPHVVMMYEEGKLDDGTPYIVMELLRGENLVERLERTETEMSLGDIAKLLGQVATALEAVHSQGIVHRDLKAENIFLIGEQDQLCGKLIDFGLAKTPDMPGRPKLTAPGMLVGSPEYMSPEQIVASMDVDLQADLWAVGVIAYVCATLALPFSGESLAKVFGDIRGGSFSPPSQLRTDLPRELDAWFARAFAVDRTARFGSAREMAEAWRQACGLDEPSASGSSHVVLISIVASALLLLVGVALALSQCG